jgi:hypothetical protein
VLPNQVVVHLMYTGIIAGVATILSGALVLPTLAGDELRANIADALQGLGHSLSGCGTASLLTPLQK